MSSSTSHARRFQVNPDPLRVRGEIPRPDPDAGRCVALIHGPGPEDAQPQCLCDARWIVTTVSGIEVGFCTQHLRARQYRTDDPAVRPA